MQATIHAVRSTRWATLLGVALLVMAPGAAWAQTADFSGVWETTYGMLELTQEGERVEGSYAYAGGSTLQGRVEGRILSFTYQEPSASGQGWFELEEDGRSFLGQWQAAGTEAWWPWRGERSVRAAAIEQSRGFSGLFDSTFGRLRLSRDGERVTGSYTYGGGSTLEGQIEGDRLVFAYEEPDATGEGWFELAEDGQALVGNWRAEGGNGSWGDWRATRVEADPDRVWLVVLEAPWETRLDEVEYAFGDMLRSYFQRMPTVSVRHRRMYDVADFERSAAELAYLAEPVALVVASHGIDGELILHGERLGAEHFQRALANAPNVFLLHFSACDTMTDGLPDAILSGLPSSQRLAISGYASFVDWAASALVEFLYLELVLSRGLSPSEAGAVVLREMRFAGETVDHASPLGAARFRLVEQ